MAENLAPSLRAGRKGGVGSEQSALDCCTPLPPSGDAERQDREMSWHPPVCGALPGALTGPGASVHGVLTAEPCLQARSV